MIRNRTRALIPQTRKKFKYKYRCLYIVIKPALDVDIFVQTKNVYQNVNAQVKLTQM